MYMLTERLLSFNLQRFTLHKNEKRNLELYRRIPSSTNLLNYPRIKIGKIAKTIPRFPGSATNTEQLTNDTTGKSKATMTDRP